MYVWMCMCVCMFCWICNSLCGLPSQTVSLRKRKLLLDGWLNNYLWREKFRKEKLVLHRGLPSCTRIFILWIVDIDVVKKMFTYSLDYSKNYIVTKYLVNELTIYTQNQLAWKTAFMLNLDPHKHIMHHYVCHDFMEGAH